LIAAIIPCFKVRKHIKKVIEDVSRQVKHIYIVDDCCPEKTGQFVESLQLANTTVIFNQENLGVGGATKAGLHIAANNGYKYLIKVDGDGQMDPTLIPIFLEPLQLNQADYTKGNRFYRFEYLKDMPKVRLIGNAGLSFISKVTSGYWDIMDPTNGFVAMKANVVLNLPLSKIENRYFFESDLLYHLSLIRAHVKDIPMKALYGDEVSNLSIFKTLLDFPSKYLVRLFKRIIYNYFLRDFNIGSVAFIFMITSAIIGIIFGSYHWYNSITTNIAASAGTVMIAGLLVFFAIQMFVLFVLFDIQNRPKEAQY